jgi:hypothetical protein
MDSIKLERNQTFGGPYTLPRTEIFTEVKKSEIPVCFRAENRREDSVTVTNVMITKQLFSEFYKPGNTTAIISCAGSSPDMNDIDGVRIHTQDDWTIVSCVEGKGPKFHDGNTRSAHAIFEDEDGNILTCQAWFEGDVEIWSGAGGITDDGDVVRLPNGVIDLVETARKTLQRELPEETGQEEMPIEIINFKVEEKPSNQNPLGLDIHILAYARYNGKFDINLTEGKDDLRGKKLYYTKKGKSFPSGKKLWDEFTGVMPELVCSPLHTNNLTIVIISAIMTLYLLFFCMYHKFIKKHYRYNSECAI